MAETAWTRALLSERIESFRKALTGGAGVLFGTDAGAGWISSGRTAIEFERRVGAGQSERAAITSATSQSAKALGLESSIGDLRPGMVADVIAVEGNPLNDITALGRVAFVMKHGTVYKRPLQTRRKPARWWRIACSLLVARELELRAARCSLLNFVADPR